MPSAARPARQPRRYFVITLAVASDFGQMISNTPLPYWRNIVGVVALTTPLNFTGPSMVSKVSVAMVCRSFS